MMKFLTVKKKLFITILMIVLFSITFSITIISATGATSSDSEQQSSSSSSLSSDEIEKILQDLKTNSNSEDIESQIEALLQRAILTGNTTLKEYSEYLKQYYQLNSQLNEVDAEIKALCIKSPELASINSEFQKSMETGINLEQIQSIVPSNVASILANLDSTSLAIVESYLMGIDNIDKIIEDPTILSDEDKNLLSSSILQLMIDQGLIEGDDLESAKSQLESTAVSLSAQESKKYTDSERARLKHQSDEFAKIGNKTASAYPEQVVLSNSSLKLTNCAIMYDNQLLISLNDILRFTNGKVQYTDNSSTMAIESDGYLVEFTVGNNIGYSNDKQVSMPVPVLTYNGITYISVEFYAQAYGLEYTNISDQGVFVIS